MGRPLVVDASAALGVLLREPGSDEARTRLTEAAGAPDTGLLVPSHFWLELTNVLVRRYRMSPDAVVAALQALDDLGLVTIPSDRPAVLLALDRMTRFGLTSYDAAYLALAEVEDADLLTLDDRLALVAWDRAVISPKRRTSEGLGPYGKRPATPRWERHGRYLAGLRRAAQA